ncbi:MAG: cyclase family protein [Spirochaetes bacterium]|nr:MAG: cyclase family protein [Spirochaetota bacterium]
MDRFIDLSHEIEDGMITYKGLPAPAIGEHMGFEDSHAHYGPGTEFTIGRIEMVANTGTYVDSPYHRHRAGADLAALPLASLANLEGVLVSLPAGTRAADASHFSGLALAGKAVLVYTGWDAHWRTETYYSGHPHLTRDAAMLLAQSRVALVGIDSYNIDSTLDLLRPVHTILLGAGIPIVEHLCGLEALRGKAFRFFAVPPMVKRFGSFPVRAFAIVAE